MPRIKSEFIKFKIGGMVISFVLGQSPKGFCLKDAYKPFLVSSGQPEVVLHSHYGLIPSFDFNEPLFESNGFWRVYQSDGRLIFWQASGRYYPTLAYKLITLESNFRSGDIYIRPQGPESNSLIYLLDYPLDKILIASLLSSNQGMLLHACGVKNKEEGLLFVGPSGSGKSTLAELWKNKKAVSILSDEFVILKKKDKDFFIYGTPWSGTALTSSPECAPLRKIFFIRPEPKNTLRFKKGVEITSNLLSHSLLPSWDRQGLESILELCEDLSQGIPGYELGFVPEESVLDFIRAKA